MLVYFQVTKDVDVSYFAHALNDNEADEIDAPF